MQKPPAVAEAVSHAIGSFGNSGRSFHNAGMLASREIYRTREAIAHLIGSPEPLSVAFTSSATESLNLVIGGLIGSGDRVITSVAEHNSVLRPLYRTGCTLDFLDCDDTGRLALDSLPGLIRPNTRFAVITHGSNVTGNLTDAARLLDMCRAHNITLILDISQTFGVVPVDTGMADIFCFTGHKGLFGPQGTGGVIATGKFNFSAVKTGGAGQNSFDRLQVREMPDVFEAGTQNSHGIYGLQKGVQFISDTGIEKIHAREMRLLKLFYDGVTSVPRVQIYGDFSDFNRLPVISLNIAGLGASDLAARLWDEYEIATRAGSHCAPLLHTRLGTAQRGMVRFSFSYFNTEYEINRGISAIEAIANSPA